MKLRNFVSIFSLIIMFVGASFGVFYLITGQNILTGQHRNSQNVLPASDSKNNLGEKVSTSSTPKTTPQKNEQVIQKEDLNPELLKFKENWDQTSNKLSFTLDSLSENDEASVVIRFGENEKGVYVASHAVGLENTDKYYVWLRQGTVGFVKVGELKKLDDSEDLKTSSFLDKKKLADFNKAYVVNKDTEGMIDIKDVVYSIDLSFKLSPSGDTREEVKSTPAVTPTKAP